MKERIRIKQAIIVEGRYDKIKLESVVEALIIPTHGFSIFTDEETKDFIRAMAADRGIVLLTDSDAAGFKIRGFLRGIVPTEQITDVYIPDVFGKEKRKSSTSKEGKLGVEGMSREILERALEQAGVLSEDGATAKHITKTDFYVDGFYGRADSASRRNALYKRLGLPTHLSVKQAVPLLCSILTREEYDDIVVDMNQVV